MDWVTNELQSEESIPLGEGLLTWFTWAKLGRAPVEPTDCDCVCLEDKATEACFCPSVIGVLAKDQVAKCRSVSKQPMSEKVKELMEKAKKCPTGSIREFLDCIAG